MIYGIKLKKIVFSKISTVIKFNLDTYHNLNYIKISFGDEFKKITGKTVSSSIINIHDFSYSNNELNI